MIKGVRDLDEKLDMRPKIENRYRSVGTGNSEERVVRVRLRSGARKRRDLAFRFRLTEKNSGYGLPFTGISGTQHPTAYWHTPSFFFTSYFSQ
jgi:hypothetical protein